MEDGSNSAKHEKFLKYPEEKTKLNEKEQGKLNLAMAKGALRYTSCRYWHWYCRQNP